jgi:predicted ATP-grasp superfamily ATP-dependent carboligase
VTTFVAARPPAVVLGLGQNGLATVRALGRLGVPVVAIDSDLAQPGARTRYARKVQCADFANGGPGLVECLERVADELGTKPVLLPSGDINLSVVSDHRERLAERYRLSLPSREVLHTILDKKAFYRFAQERGLPIANTWFVAGPEEVRGLRGRVRYPVLIKPYQPTAAWRKAFDTRLFIANGDDQLVALYDRLFAVHHDLLVQEYIPGSDGDLCWGVTYLRRDGGPAAVWTGLKLRQYPRGFGTATLAESRWQPKVAATTLHTLRTLGHTGYGVVEFKRDARDGSLRITEVTGGRTWFPHGIVTSAGINLPYIWYCDVLGLPLPAPALDGRGFVEGLRWIHEERDLKTVWLYFLGRDGFGLREWLRSYRGRRTYAYAAWDDPGPILASAGRVVRTGMRRVRRLGRRSAGGPKGGRRPTNWFDLAVEARNG